MAKGKISISISIKLENVGCLSKGSQNLLNEKRKKPLGEPDGF